MPPTARNPALRGRRAPGRGRRRISAPGGEPDVPAHHAARPAGGVRHRGLGPCRCALLDAGGLGTAETRRDSRRERSPPPPPARPAAGQHPAVAPPRPARRRRAGAMGRSTRCGRAASPCARGSRRGVGDCALVRHPGPVAPLRTPAPFARARRGRPTAPFDLRTAGPRTRRAGRDAALRARHAGPAWRDAQGSTGGRRLRPVGRPFRDNGRLRRTGDADGDGGEDQSHGGNHGRVRGSLRSHDG